MSKIQDKINKIRNLVQYRNKSEKDLCKIAERLLAEEEKERNRFRPDWKGLDKNTKKWADNRFKAYRDRFHIESYSDLLLLVELSHHQ